MRLLELKSNGECSLTTDLINNIPPYAILSHTWGQNNEEVTFQDLVQGAGKSKTGYAKIRFCEEQARRDRLQHFWIDTCCIDKSNNTELSEAINSIFRWYRDATKCYVYLLDVSAHGSNVDDKSNRSSWETAFRTSRWFTRGWTLQELIAPTSVEFFSKEGELLGNKKSLERYIHEITGIPIKAIQGGHLSDFSITERMLWAEKRETTREEDKAYSLLGIFDVHMPLIYGEGGMNAFRRLREEIDKPSRFYKLDKSYNKQAAFSSSEQPEVANIFSSVAGSLKRKHDTVSRDSELAQLEDKASIIEALSYHPLPEFSFRILILESGVAGSNIIGSMHVYDLRDPPPYYALSYVWGQEPAIHPVKVNGKTKFIQPNLYHALQRIRLQEGHIHVWVDSLCINQQNHSEKNVQVRQMATIYNKASSVLIWLGEADSTSKFALQLVSRIVSNDFKWDDSWWEKYELIALGQILERPWFQRGWVLQEAAFSRNSTIYCGDDQVHMNRFSMAVDLVRAAVSTIQPPLNRIVKTMRLSTLSYFQDSAAVRLLDTIEGAFRKLMNGDILDRNMSLETIVDLSTFSETTDPRDTIYAFLNLANDTALVAPPYHSGAIIPDYDKGIIDVFAEFILHCCHNSGSLDIICRPWAPVLPSAAHSVGRDGGQNLRTYPSWIAPRDHLPFGNPSWRLNNRLHGNPLVGRSKKRAYNAHYGSKPQISIGTNEDGTCNGSLHARGIIIGEVGQRSSRLADAIVTKECLEILGIVARNPQSGIINLSDTIWRTLCADRDENGEPAPRVYRIAMLHLLQISSGTPHSGDPTNLLHDISSIDIEELLETEMPDHVTKFLMVIRDVIWNRRTFRSRARDNNGEQFVGLIPPKAKVGDHICILNGCSVPVVLRKLPSSMGEFYWNLIGDAYVHGIMNGELIRSASFRPTESDFIIH